MKRLIMCESRFRCIQGGTHQKWETSMQRERIPRGIRGPRARSRRRNGRGVGAVHRRHAKDPTRPTKKMVNKRLSCLALATLTVALLTAMASAQDIPEINPECEDVCADVNADSTQGEADACLYCNVANLKPECESDCNVRRHPSSLPLSLSLRLTLTPTPYRTRRSTALLATWTRMLHATKSRC